MDCVRGNGGDVERWEEVMGGVGMGSEWGWNGVGMGSEWGRDNMFGEYDKQNESKIF